MSKAVKLKSNLYLDTRGIVHNKKILNTILFPVGYVYLSVNNTNPGTIFGGTWEQISGYYLYLGTDGTKTSYTGIGTQGHTLTQAQMPKHRHGIGGDNADLSRACYNYGNIVGGGGVAIVNPSTSYQHVQGYYISEKGGDQPHSHNIATYQVYAWKRVS